MTLDAESALLRMSVEIGNRIGTGLCAVLHAPRHVRISSERFRCAGRVGAMAGHTGNAAGGRGSGRARGGLGRILDGQLRNAGRRVLAGVGSIRAVVSIVTIGDLQLEIMIERVVEGQGFPVWLESMAIGAPIAPAP